MNKKPIAWTRLTREQSTNLAKAIYRYAKEKQFSLSAFCSYARVPVSIPSTLFSARHRRVLTEHIENVILATGFTTMADATEYGESYEALGKKPKYRKAKRKISTPRLVIGPVVSGSPLVKQLNALSKSDQDKVRKLILFLYNKSQLRTLANDVREFCEVSI